MTTDAHTDQGLFGQAAPAKSEASQTLGATPEWTEIRTRLFAIRALQSGDALAARMRRCGSFDTEAASVVSAYGVSSMPVNPNVSSNGKPADGTRFPDAALIASGGRGQR